MAGKTGQLTSQIVLFGIGSGLVVEFEETCRRLDIAIAAGVQNTSVPSLCSGHIHTCTPDELGHSQLDLPFIVPLFTPANRMSAAHHARDIGFHAAACLIDPTAVVASTSTVGKGSFINSATVIGAASRLGDFVIVNRNSSLGHHNQIEDYASIGPGCTLCGGVKVGTGSMIGAGSVILPDVTVGPNATIGAGSVICRDVAAGTEIIQSR